MRILLPSVVRLLNGAQIIVKPLNARLSKKERVRNTIRAKIVEWWLNEKKNKWIIQNRLFRLAMDGMAVGTFYGKGCLYQPVVLKSFVKAVTKRKRSRKIKNGGRTDDAL